MSDHKYARNNHVLESFVFADAAARGAGTGYTLSTADIGRIGYQTDTGAYWRLTAVSGGGAPTWAGVGGGGASGATVLFRARKGYVTNGYAGNPNTPQHITGLTVEVDTLSAYASDQYTFAANGLYRIETSAHISAFDRTYVLGASVVDGSGNPTTGGVFAGTRTEKFGTVHNMDTVGFGKVQCGYTASLLSGDVMWLMAVCSTFGPGTGPAEWDYWYWQITKVG